VNVAEDRELKAMKTSLDALRPLDPEERQRVVDWLAAKLGLDGPPSAGGAHGDGHADRPRDGNLGTSKRFLKEKRPPDDAARVTTLAYYLSHGKGQATYKTADLTKARVEAALASFNMSRAVSNAQRAGYLTTAAGRGTYQVTSTGEALVEAMPDVEAMRNVKAQRTRRRRTSTGATHRSTKTARQRSSE
jgi:hypothetical protein